MNQLYKKIILFVFPVFCLLILWPIDKRYQYRELQEDCDYRGTILFDRIHHNENPIDIAFFGSSHTINAINDTLIGRMLNKDKCVFNFGYCRFGQNLYYSLLKELIKEKKPEILFIEIREDESPHSHKMFPYIADTKDVLLPRIFFNKDILQDIYTHFSYKTVLVQDVIFDRTDKAAFSHYDSGFMAGSGVALTSFLDSIKQLKRTLPVPLKPYERDFYMKYPGAYLEITADLCRKNNIKLFFLYLPSYGSPNVLPLEYNTYARYGKILIPPREIFEKQLNWSDENHFNQKGAYELSNWLVKHICTIGNSNPN